MIIDLFNDSGMLYKPIVFLEVRFLGTVIQNSPKWIGGAARPEQREKDCTSLKAPLPQPKLLPDMAFVIGYLPEDLEMRAKSNFISESSEADGGYRCPTQDADREGQRADLIFI